MQYCCRTVGLLCVLVVVLVSNAHCFRLRPKSLVPLSPLKFDQYHSQRDCSVVSLARDLKTKIVSETDASATLRNLVHFGDSWSRKAVTDVPTLSPTTVHSQFEKVSGCSSAVEIRTSLVGDSTIKSIAVHGKADSRVTQGMVAVLCQIFSSLTLEEALAVQADELTTYFGFDALLPMGRQNTFLNTVKLIQAQLQRLATVSSTATSEGGSVQQTVSVCGLSPIESQQDDAHHRAKSVDETQSHALSSFTKIPTQPSAGSVPSHSASPTTPPAAADPRASEIAMLLSGGVDSSVALQLLLEQGHKVRAYYLKIWLEDELAHLNSCPWEEDLQYARAVCAQLNVPLETVSLQREYWRDVVQYTLAEAQSGRTPNPDVMCNSQVKFGTFYDYVGRFHAKIATGHYAQVQPRQQLQFVGPSPATSSDHSPHIAENIGLKDQEDDTNEVVLLRSPDPVKDQSYFLCNLSQQQLRRCVFPIGHLHKSQVRALAEQYNLPTKHRKDSQGICFLGKLKFDDFIEHYLGQHPGPIRCATTGVQLGTHRGLWFHTIGQRKGLGLLMKPGTVHTGPWFVRAKDVRRNTLYVSNDTHIVDSGADGSGVPAPATDAGYLVQNVNWINGIPEALKAAQADKKMEVQIKLRHSPHFVPGGLQLVAAHTSNPPYGARTPKINTDTDVDANLYTAQQGTRISVVTEQETGREVRMFLHEPDASVAPGQFAAFYLGDVCIGAGVIADIPFEGPVPAWPEEGDVREISSRKGGKKRSAGRSMTRLGVPTAERVRAETLLTAERPQRNGG